MDEIVTVQPINENTLVELTKILNDYKAGKSNTDARIKASEKWWKLRNASEEQKITQIGKDGFAAKSGWLHNVIVSKHADAMDAYPEPNVLPREPGDKQEAKMLSSILPVVLEQNHFESTYSDVMWQKMKSGTGLYKVFWDSAKHHGIGDIGVDKVNLLNVFWEPGVTDIQRSKYFFHTELVDKDSLAAERPDLSEKLTTMTMPVVKFEYDDTVKDDNKCVVIDCYYKKNGKLHFVKFVGDVILYATENDRETAERGLYDHGLYPYVFDALFPIEGSPCGYGYVDLCQSSQTEIDLLKTAMVKNAMVGATPRYFLRGDAGINETEFLDLSKPIVHIPTSVNNDYLRPIDHTRLDGAYANLLDRTTQELRETSGNTESASGVAPSGVTAASAIAALQEASGKGSRDSTLSAYRAYTKVVELCIELIRQFYDIPRKFRITGQYGAEAFVMYTNAGIKPQHQGEAFGMDMGFRTPVFDIKVSAQKKSVYTKVSQNELAIQFFQLGFFNPQVAPQALMCLEMMDFDGKDDIAQKVSQNGSLAQKLLQYMQLAAGLAQTARPELLPMIQQDMAMVTGVPLTAQKPAELSNPEDEKEPGIVKNARQRSKDAAQPDENREVAG